VAHPSTRPTQTPQRASVTRPPALSGASVRGGASWYCEPGVSACPYGYSGGMYAAAGPGTRTLLGPNWRGKIVVTCSTNSPTRCISVKLVDWCACPNGRVIDLFATAFIRLAPLSQGTLMVRVSLLP
jgi:rare lipoprotein A (peptidoglycan hydrolase)